MVLGSIVEVPVSADRPGGRIEMIDP